MGADGLGLRSGCDEMSELRRDALERDEKRLAELGRRTVEMYAIAHVFTERLEVREAAARRQSCREPLPGDLNSVQQMSHPATTCVLWRACWCLFGCSVRTATTRLRSA